MTVPGNQSRYHVRVQRGRDDRRTHEFDVLSEAIDFFFNLRGAGVCDKLELYDRSDLLNSWRRDHNSQPS